MAIIQHGEKVRKALLQGMESIAKAIRSTYGPKGRYVMVYHPSGRVELLRDGQKVAGAYHAKERFENLGAALFKQVAGKVGEELGDGTTTASILCEAIIKEGAKLVSAGVNPMELKRELDIAVESVEVALTNMAEPLNSPSLIRQVANIASGRNENFGQLICEAIEKVGVDGGISVEEGKGRETFLEVVEGFEVAKGFLSPYFVTNSQDLCCELEEANLLITEEKIDSAMQLIPFLENYSENGGVAPLVIVADKIEDEALTTLVLNKVKGGMSLCAVEAPEFGEQKTKFLEDLALLSGGKVLSKQRGLDLESADISVLGRVRKAKIYEKKSLFIGGYGDQSEIQEKISQLKNEITKATTLEEKNHLESRKASLSGGVALIKVGAATDLELREKVSRINDALATTLSAAQEGVLPGGGSSYLRAICAIDTPETTYGAKILIQALKAPLIALAENCGKSGEVIAEKVMEMPSGMGYDAENDQFSNLRDLGIIDSAKTLKRALRVAASIGGIALTTTSMIAEKKGS